MKPHPILRKPFLLLAALAVWALSVYLIPLLDGGQDPPPHRLGQAPAKFLSAAEKAGARDIQPRRFTRCQDQLRQARFEMNLQSAGFWGTRDFRRASRLMDQTQSDSFRLWRDVAAHQRKSRLSADDAIRLAEENMDEAEVVTSVSQQDTYVHSKLASASMLLGRAKSYRAAGRYDQALADANESCRLSFQAHQRSKQVLARYDDPGHLRSWKAWIRQAVEASAQTGGVSFVVIKERHVLDVYRSGKLVRTVPVDLGANSINQKSHAGDRTTPEGLYHVTRKKGRGASRYGLALLLDYPNAEDRRRFALAKQNGQLTRRTGIGGLIEIHGEGGRGYDWTDGCVAPSDSDMAVLYNWASTGTPVAIVGSDGSDGPVRTILRRAEMHR